MPSFDRPGKLVFAVNHFRIIPLVALPLKYFGFFIDSIEPSDIDVTCKPGDELTWEKFRVLQDCGSKKTCNIKAKLIRTSDVQGVVRNVCVHSCSSCSSFLAIFFKNNNKPIIQGNLWCYKVVNVIFARMHPENFATPFRTYFSSGGLFMSSQTAFNWRTDH